MVKNKNTFPSIILQHSGHLTLVSHQLYIRKRGYKLLTIHIPTGNGQQWTSNHKPRW
jgi:hypothetical protein